MIEPVTDQESHQRALRRIEALWNTEPGSPEERELDALATLVDAYERKRFPVLPPDPVQAIKVRCEQLGWTRKDLEPLLGSRARVSEVLGGKRALTLPMIRKVQASMQIPADILIAAPAGRRKSTKRAA
jgi:HTH-type transcriptional regulator/antitoxin HigA